MAEDLTITNEETTKPKRGRPAKKEAPVENEGVEKVTMRKVAKQVGEVTNSTDMVTYDDVQRQWRQIFSKYSNVGLDTIMAQYGASLTELNNPYVQNYRVKKINSAPMKLTRQEMEEALLNPESHEEQLRRVSMWLYYSNYIYQQVIQLNRNVPKYHYYYVPLYLEDKKDDKVKEDSIRIDKLLKKFNPQYVFKTIATQVASQGKCTYLCRGSFDKKHANYLVLQKLNQENVKITGFGSKQTFIVSFDMSIFMQPGYSIDQYPPFIKNAWKEMWEAGVIVEDKRGAKRINPKAKLPLGHILESRGSGSYFYWVQLPQDLAWTFSADASHPLQIPMEIGLDDDMNDLNSYRWLQSNLATKGTTALLTAEVELTKDAKAGSDATIISPDVILGYQDLFRQTVSEQYEIFIAPFKDFELHTFDNEPESLNIVYNHIKELMAASGLSGLLPITDKPSIASIKAQEALFAEKVNYLTKQFEAFINDYINNNYELNYEWTVKFWGDVFYERDDAKNMKELFINGATGILPKLLSAYDISVEDYKGSTEYLDLLGVKIKTDKQEEKNPVGRPKINDDEVENDDTEASKSAGNDVSDIK